MSEVTDANRAKRIRRANRRLRWTKGAYRLVQIAPQSYRPRVRREAIARLLQTRQWRMALTVAVMPNGHVLHTDDYTATDSTTAYARTVTRAQG